MRSIILILLIVYGCFGCTNSNVYSRGETPDWYLEPAVECSSHESKVCEELGATLACECVA
tara:strand:- start:376 stop:558 length:183 start_codon:yes stop_codon:yes gene_type:complete